MMQAVLEQIICQLTHEFIEQPYRFFTEADAVAPVDQLHTLHHFAQEQIMSRDQFAISRIHREYPTFFRFDDANPIARLDADSRARRGHYDTVVLNPEFIRIHDAETIKNRKITATRAAD